MTHDITTQGSHLDLETIAFYPRGLVLFWRVVSRLVHPDLVGVGDRIVREFLEAPPHGRAEAALIERLADDSQVLPFKAGELHFLSAFDLAMQLDEIFVREHYTIRTAPDDPCRPLRIIDAGANIGLATVRLKLLRPSARITAIEPNPLAAEVIRRNIASFGLDDADVLEAALSTEDGEMPLMVCDEMPMATSLTSRIASRSMEVRELRVPTVDAARLVAEAGQVDLLKIDIEGSEYAVLDALAGRLGAVRQMFCEFHFGKGLPKSLLTGALSVLDGAGMDWIMTKAQDDWVRALMQDNWAQSMNLWARRP